MLDEVVQLLQPERGGLFVDCTVGLGGHARRAARTRRRAADRARSRSGGAGDRARRAGGWGDRVELVHADYRELATVLDDAASIASTASLADLGVSSMQLDAEGRGFSFRRDEPLDMRMDTTRRARPRPTCWRASTRRNWPT